MNYLSITHPIIVILLLLLIIIVSQLGWKFSKMGMLPTHKKNSLFLFFPTERLFTTEPNEYPENKLNSTEWNEGTFTI